MKKQFLILFAFISVLALSQVPQRFNKVIVTGDITSPKFIKTGSTADSVLLGNGSARAISTIKTDTVNLSNRINAKATGNGTANGTNTGDETLTSIKTKLGAATPVSDGYLRYQDFADFADRVSNATHTGDVTGSAALTLATVNSNVGTFNNVTINAKGLATAGSNNLTSSLSTNYIPKWNGTNFVNATAATDYQLPITLTTNGTSGAATFSGNMLNVPNYASSGGVDQTQTTVNGSTSGNMVCSMPFQTGSYKKVIISVNSLNGSATYTYPSPFSVIPRASSSLSITAQSTTSITIAGASAIGWCIIEGY